MSETSCTSYVAREKWGRYNDPHHATPHMFTIQLLCHRAGWDRHHASRTRKRRLPWHLSFHDQPQPASKMLARAQSDEILTGLPHSSGLCESSISGGWRGDSSLSTTSKKTMESLSSSVYDELQPFRRAHRTLIKVLDGEPPIFERILSRSARHPLSLTKACTGSLRNKSNDHVLMTHGG